MQWDSDQLAGQFRTDPELAIAIRYWTARVAIEVGTDAYLLTICEGQVRSFERKRRCRCRRQPFVTNMQGRRDPAPEGRVGEGAEALRD